MRKLVYINLSECKRIEASESLGKRIYTMDINGNTHEIDQYELSTNLDVQLWTDKELSTKETCEICGKPILWDQETNLVIVDKGYGLVHKKCQTLKESSKCK